MKYNGIIQRKLALLDEQVCNIRKYFAHLSAEEFASDWLLQSGAERAVQVAIEVMIDIAERIIALEGAGPVASAANAMDRLEGLGIIASARQYCSLVAFRNLIVHEYERIDANLLFSIISEQLGDFTRFRNEIDSFGQEEDE